MSIRYKKNQSNQKSPIRVKDVKMAKRTEKEKKIRTNNLKRRLRLAKIHRRSRHREEKRREEKRREEKRREEKIDSREGARQINMVYDKNCFYENKNKSMNFLISKGKIRKNDGMKENKIYLEKYNKNGYKIQIKNIIIIELFIIIDIITILPSNKWYSIEFNLSKITLKIKGTGIKNILGYQDSANCFNKAYFPNEVYINGELQNEVNYSYNFNQTYNFVELIWNNNINNCENMFRRCYDITEFDFSNFETSEVTTMWCMFLYCSSLTSLNLSNFITSKVTNMGFIFKGCINLEYINLQNFNEIKEIKYFLK